MMSHKTTKKNYKLFVHECQRLIRKWGLRDWKVYYERDDDENNRGRLWHDARNHVATIQLSKKWDIKPTRKSIKFCARHEVTHLLFAVLSELGSSRCFNEDEFQREKERVARHLQSILFPSKSGMCEK